jgi:hypothetical protein
MGVGVTRVKNATDIAISAIAIALICMILLGQYALNSPAYHLDEKSHKRVKPSASPLPSPTPSRPMMIGQGTAVFAYLVLFTY